ncbi:MAG: lytic murein transglycosylase [Rhodospirillales bacterium]|nr:lytic murein transglycosylase [Rhodospirillales bacterium]MBO6786875.1 lytic murein transglycosylase [Rhodospirillales bacterium]
MIKFRNVLAALAVASSLALPAASHAAEPFVDWLKGFRGEAARAGIADDVLDKALGAVAPIPRVLELDRRQPEFMLTLWRYMELYVPDARIEKGKELLKKHARLLAEVEKKYGVPPRFLVAFWGVETDFGRNFGAFHMLSAVATLAHDARRADFFKTQFMSAIRLVGTGDVPVDVKSSWAGAMGNMQFIPTTFEAYAVDHDGDGRRDLWNSLPDAFASASNYLSRVGWQPDYTWGREVQMPKDFDLSLAGLHTKKKLADWQKLGIRKVGGGALPAADIDASLLLPAGAEGPSFLVYQNFRTIMRWNTSQLYAIAVGHLADRFIGLPPLSVKKPANAQMLRFVDIEEMQRLLTRIGFDTGGIDGRAGPMTRNAIRAFQKSVNLPADAHPTFGLLERLRAAAN